MTEAINTPPCNIGKSHSDSVYNQSSKSIYSKTDSTKTVPPKVHQIAIQQQ